MTSREFEKKMIPYYERYDKAFETNDIKELAYLAQFCIEEDIRKWDSFRRRQVCENMNRWDMMKEYGYTEIILNECGWLEWKFKNYLEQEFYPLSIEINRGCCNTKDPMAIGILQVPNGNWVAKVGYDFTSIGKSFIYLGINITQYPTRTEAWNTELKKYIDDWHRRYPNVKKEDESVKKARSLIITQMDCFSELPPMPRQEPVQLELFTF